MNREITIVGGGLAGLSLACALRLGNVPVTVLEAGSYPRHRVCGEFVSGVGAETLAALGIADAFEDGQVLRSLRWFECGRLILRNVFNSPALGISRYRLDASLKARAEKLGAIVESGTRALPEPRHGLVWTAGRRPCKGSWIGLKAHVRNLPASADLEMHAGTNGYAGFSAVENGWINVCGLFRLDRSIHANGADLFPAYLEAGGNYDLARSLRSAGWRVGSFTAVSGFELGRQPAVPGMLALGDAESMIPPFTGNGMSMAFQAAEIACEPLAEWSRGRRSWQDAANAVRAELRRKFRRRLAVARGLHAMLLDAGGRAFIGRMSSAGLLPFHPLLALIR